MCKVKVEYDGCPTDTVLFEGTYDQCKGYMRAMWRKYNKGKQSFMLVGPSGRCMSFVL